MNQFNLASENPAKMRSNRFPEHIQWADDMRSARVYPLHSDGYLEVVNFFAAIEPPYTLSDIREFNRLYRRVYPMLGQVEKHKAEQWVDHLIQHVEKPEWARKIYGVV